MFNTYFCYYLLLYEILNSKYTDNNRLDINTSSVFLSPSASSKTLKIYQKDDTKINIDEPDNLQSTNERENICSKPKVRNVTKNKENCTMVAIQVSKNGIVEVISDKETMV